MVPITVSRAICTVCTKNANGLYKRIYQERFCACIRVHGWRVVRCSSSCFDFLPHELYALLVQGEDRTLAQTALATASLHL